MPSFNPRETPLAKSVSANDGMLEVDLVDGRRICMPLDWYPRLAFATEDELSNVDFFADGEALRWPMLDEDIRTSSLLSGGRSMEGAGSFQRWKEEMQRRRAEGRLKDPWGEEYPLPDDWEDDSELETPAHQPA